MKKLIISLFLVPQIVFAIYGVDDRKDLFEVKDSAIKELAKSVAYQVDKNELKGWTFNRLWTLRTSTLENRRVCSDQRYAKQGAIRAECSGVLIGEDLLLTAGNCITEHYCYNDLYYWVFNYSLKEKSTLIEKLPKKDFYKCDKVVKRVYDPNSSKSFAILKLKKKVQGIKPVRVASERVRSDDELIVMGHPQGMPIKVSISNRVIENHSDYFYVNSDISGETKGAPIFNSSLELVGFSVYGTKNYFDSGRGCKELVKFDDIEGQEVFQNIDLIKKYL